MEYLLKHISWLLICVSSITSFRHRQTDWEIPGFRGWNHGTSPKDRLAKQSPPRPECSCWNQWHRVKLGQRQWSQCSFTAFLFSDTHKSTLVHLFITFSGCFLHWSGNGEKTIVERVLGVVMGSHTRVGQYAHPFLSVFYLKEEEKKSEHLIIMFFSFIPGCLLEMQVTPADHHASSTSSSSTGGKDLHWQVSLTSVPFLFF